MRHEESNWQQNFQNSIEPLNGPKTPSSLDKNHNTEPYIVDIPARTIHLPKPFSISRAIALVFSRFRLSQNCSPSNPSPADVSLASAARSTSSIFRSSSSRNCCASVTHSALSSVLQAEVIERTRGIKVSRADLAGRLKNGLRHYRYKDIVMAGWGTDARPREGKIGLKMKGQSIENANWFDLR